ncbi:MULTISPECIES: response regulator [Niastella]|uniref:Response regulator n=1 Tax=Niastella soli TaxID=2821487 RepID=A0ABS3YVL9_9BACT|nr:response regulator [Niastella soli]MBO9201923.1 response regulator [Niastella soli]
MSYPNRIFLIDDDEDDGFVFNEALNSLPHQFELLYYQDSEQALARLSDNAFSPPDIMFIDWNMPKLSGNHCLQSIRKLPGYDAVPIIIYSTSNHEQLQAEARQLGASHFLAKPSTLKELVIKLEAILNKQKGNN